MEKVINIFGDSITWGAGDAEMGGWADRLKNHLGKDKDEEDYFETYNLGIGGDNSDKLLKRFSTENEARNPDTIIIAIGINDSQWSGSRENSRVPLERFESNLEEMVKEAQKFTKEIVFVGITRVDESKVSPTFWDPSKHYDNENIARYDAKIKEVCERNGLLFVEMMDLLKDSDLEDGLHPNVKGYEKMFLRVRDFLADNKII